MSAKRSQHGEGTTRHPVGLSRRAFLRGTAAGLPLLLAAACAPAATPSAAPAAATVAPKTAATAAPAAAVPKAGGTLRIALTAEPRTFNPARQLELWQWGGLYDSLLRYTPKQDVYGHLAESYEVIEDGKAIDLKLRKGVKFASGREFNADDIDWMISWIKLPAAGALFRTFALAVTQVEKVDPYRVILRMDQPDAGLIDLLGNMYIPDRERMDTIDQAGYGTGPFTFVEFVPGDRIVFKRNESYWGQKAYLDGINVKIIGDPQAVVANLEAGTIDYASVPLTEYQRLKNDPRLKSIKMVGGGGITNVWLNMTRKPFDNKTVRQAMNYAIDRERFVRTIVMGESKPLWQPFADYHWAHFPELENKYPFDLDKAKAMLAEAGLGSGFATTINAVANDVVSMGLAQIIQSDLAKINVKATIDAKDSPAWAEASDRGNFDINMHNYGRNNADPTLLFKGTVAWRPEKNPTGIEDPEYLKLINDQAVVIDRLKRKPLVKKLIEYVQDQSFVMPVAGGVSCWMFTNKLNGLEIIPIGVVGYMEKVWLNQ